jgi:hypothetical protein
MNKKKYVAPACECIVLNSVNMLAASVRVFNETTDADAAMSNIQRNLKTDLDNLDW